MADEEDENAQAGGEEAEELTEEELEELRQKALAAASRQLFESARAGDTPGALEALEGAGRVDLSEGEVDPTKEGSYWTALHYAALKGDASLVNALLAKDAHKAYREATEKKLKREVRQAALLASMATSGGGQAGGGAGGGSVAGGKGEEEKDIGEEFEEDEGSGGAAVLMNTPLLWSAFKGHMSTTLSLLDAGYSLEDTDSVGNTALHLAAASQVLPVVELLLRSGANPTAKNRFTLSPLEVATVPLVRKAIAKASESQSQAAAAAVTASAREAASKLASKLEGPIETDGGAEKSGRAAGGKKAELAAAAKRQREEMRKAQSAHLRTMAGKVTALIERDPPGTLDGELARIGELQKAREAALATNGVVDLAIIRHAEALIKRYQVSTSMRGHLSATSAQHPVVTQRVYCDFVNKLERFAKLGSEVGVDQELLEEAHAAIARSFAEFWLFKIVEELKVVECAASELVPRIDLLEKRIKNAEVSQADEGLVGGATKVLDRLRSELALAGELKKVPPYKLPPAEEETEGLNKKQLAAFLAEFWGPDDVGRIKETTEADGCHPFPLPPGFGKEEDDEEWNKHPLKPLCNTPEGYIWIPAKALVRHRAAQGPPPKGPPRGA
mmetsp:Transcript_70548/g.159591  ORF Transcript_70548/g.159591 Transcript_70548/m.159591 type:complete len:617 (+) Transcript_70548:164-2014(+)